MISTAYCGYSQHKYVPLATSATNTFHLRFSAAQDDLIYAEVDPGYAREIDVNTNRSFFARIRRKLGPCSSYKGPLGWRVNASPNGTIVILNFQAMCANGPLAETLTWRVYERSVRLLGYHVDSKLLLGD